MSYVSKPVRKKDAMALVTGKPVFTNDLAPKDCCDIQFFKILFIRLILLCNRNKYHSVSIFRNRFQKIFKNLTKICQLEIWNQNSNYTRIFLLIYRYVRKILNCFFNPLSCFCCYNTFSMKIS